MTKLLLLLVFMSFGQVFACSDREAALSTQNYLASYEDFQNAKWDTKFEYDEPNVLYNNKRNTVVVFRAVDSYGDKRQGVMIWGRDADFKCVLESKSSLSFL